jgi:hypothetical protein
MMWLVEAVLIIGFFVIGSARPTAQSDAVARKRGVEVENRRKRELIRQVEGDYATNNPRLERIYTVSIATFFGGGALVFIFSVPARNSSFFQLVVITGYVVQVASFLVFAVYALRKRRYLVDSLKQRK